MIPPKNPFPGLRPFNFGENHLFFGRDGQTDELLRRLRRQRFLAVVGTSGSGKSSLVRAGLLPDVYGGFMVEAGSDWRVALFKPGNDPICNLAAALSEPDALGPPVEDAEGRHIVEMTLRRSALGLGEVVREAGIEDNLLIIVDQFEEVFRFKRASTAEHPENEAAAFVKLLLEGAQQRDMPIYVLLTMRSDYLGKCAQFLGLPEAINEGLYLIPRMTRDQRREAIAGPVAVGGGEIAPRLVNRLLNDVGDNTDQLPILQHALMRTWDRWKTQSAGGPIDLPHYEQIGTMTGALSQQADEAYNELTKDEQELSQKMFKCLTEKDADNHEVRRPRTLKELIEEIGGTEEKLKGVIERFRKRAFLMPSSDKPLTCESTIDISHESLIRGWEKLRAWVDEEATSAEMYCGIAEAARLHKKGRRGLWRDPELQLALNWEKDNKPTGPWAARYHSDLQGALEFLNQSKWQRNIGRALAIAILVILAFASFWALEKEKKAREAAAVAGEQKRLAQAEALQVRKGNLKNQTWIVSLAGRLIEHATEEEGIFLHQIKADALSQMGKHEDAIREYEMVTKQLDPDNLRAPISLCYEYIVLGRPKEALESIESYLKKDETNCVAYQNKAVALAMLGRYPEAKQAMQRSIDLFRYSGNEYVEPEISPEIQEATHRRLIFHDEVANLSATHFALANLKAYAGEEGFEEALQAADQRPQSQEACLAALNWAWLQMKGRPQDYGALAAQAALWERAGRKDWARREYERFQGRHREEPDLRNHLRYQRLAAWVSERLKALQSQPLPENDKSDAATLAFEASELEALNRPEGRELLKRALEMEPGNVSLLITRAKFLLKRGYVHTEQGEFPTAEEHYRAVITDCNQILKLADTTPDAYFLRALANKELRKSDIAIDKTIEDDLRKAHAGDPVDGEVMFHMSKVLSKKQAIVALLLLERSKRADLDFLLLPYVYSQMARVYDTLKLPAKSLKAIETAIEIKNDDAEFYHQRAKAERQLRRDKVKVNLRLMEGYSKAAHTKLKMGLQNEAFDACWRGIESLLSDEGKLDADTQGHVVAFTGKISDVIEDIHKQAVIAEGSQPRPMASKAKAIEFWDTVIASGRWTKGREIFEIEKKRLEQDAMLARPEN